MKYPHEENIKNKISKKYGGAVGEPLLKDIYANYAEFRGKIDGISGFAEKDIHAKVDLLNRYINFVSQKKFSDEFTSQSKLRSTILEEFLMHLFEKVVDFGGNRYVVGPTKAYTNLSFSPKSFSDFAKNPSIEILVKDQDFSISKEIWCAFSSLEGKEQIKKDIFVPVVAIECKTYIDKTMFDGSCQSAEKLKAGNPFALFLIVAETNQMGKEINPNHSKINQIYILRKDSEKNPIQKDLVWDLFSHVKAHLDREWFNPEAAIKRGKLINRD
ncbi:MAG: Bpu10I family restriction endonuclease [Candidatus Margulisiibacteriota bacterium]